MAQVKYIELKKMVDSKEFKNLYFLCGETDLINYFENSILAGVLGKNYTEFDYTVLKGENFSAEKFKNALETFPISTAKKCVIVKDIPWDITGEKEIDEVLEILSDIPPFSTAIISQISEVSGVKNLSKLKKIQNFVKNNGILSNF